MKKIMKKNILLLPLIINTILIALLTVNIAAAYGSSKTTSPYSAEIPVADYSDQERNQAFATAFKQVVTNVSGSAKHINNPEIQTKLKDISVWVQSYNYAKNATNATSDNQSNLSLQITFDPNSIPEELRNEARLSTPTLKTEPKSGTEEIKSDQYQHTQTAHNTQTSQTTQQNKTKTDQSAPSTPILTWLVILNEDPAQNVLIDDSNNKTAPILKDRAKKAGINIILPTMDLEDITKITADDICSFDTKAINTASKRYNPQNILIGCIATPSSLTNIKISNNNNTSVTQADKHSQWMLLTTDKKYRWDLEEKNDREIINQAINKIAQVLNPPITNETTPTNEAAATTVNQQPSAPANPITTATPTAAATTTTPEMVDDNHVVLNITNVNNLDQYAAVVKYLHSIPKIARIELLSITATTVKLNITIAGGRKTIITALSSQQQLTPDSKNESTENNSLSYSWTH